MRYTLSAVLLFVASLSVQAQNLDLVEKLRGQLKGATDKETFNILCSIGFEYRYSYPDSTLIYCNRAFELGTRIGLPEDLSKPLSFIGLAYANKGDYENSFLYHRRSIELSLAQHDTVELAFSYNNLGRMFFDQGDLVRAFDNLIRSKELFENLGDKSGLAYVNRSIATVYSTQKEFDKALEMSKKAYRLRVEIGEPRMIVSSLMELGLIHQAAGDTERALASFLKADSASTKINDPVTKAELSIGLGEILMEEGNLEEAYERTKHVLTIVTEQTNQKMFLRATYLQAKYFYLRKDYQRASALLRKTLSSAENSGNVAFQRDASFMLAEIYKAANDTPRFEEFNNRYRIFSGMLENTDLERQVERLQFQIEIEKKEKENERLKANELKNTALIARQRFQNTILVVVLASIGAIAVIAWINSRRRRQINHKLELQNQHIVEQREAISRQNENLSKSNQILSDLNQEKNTLMSIVAHDLKSPLNNISGLTSILELDKHLSDDQKEYVKMIRDSTKSGLDLITDLLDVNALEEVKGGPQLEEVSVSPLLEDRIKGHKLTAENKSISIELKSDVTTPIITDINYLNRIVDNLISNAIKFSSAGSSVLIGARIDNGSLVLRVRDTGPGFREEDRQFLFQKFKKLTARPTGGESSNGLGLAIVKTLVDRLKGDIRLQSEWGKGSEFIITLPL